MNGIVLFIFIVGAVVGYSFCRVQLKGRDLLSIEHEHEEATPLPQPWRAPPPQYRRRRHPMPDKNCPNGYSAKQVLGWNDFGTIHPPQYPGGIRAWDRNVNGIYHDDEEEKD